MSFESQEELFRILVAKLELVQSVFNLSPSSRMVFHYVFFMSKLGNPDL